MGGGSGVAVAIPLAYKVGLSHTNIPCGRACSSSVSPFFAGEEKRLCSRMRRIFRFTMDVDIDFSMKDTTCDMCSS